MSAIIEFQKKLLTDNNARAEFAANPTKFLTELGVQLPDEIRLPDQIDPAVIESAVADVQQGLAEEKIVIEDIDRSDANVVVRTIEDTIATRTRDLLAAKAVHGQLAPGSDRAIIALVAAVVAAVVAVPVATFGRTADAVTRINPMAGIEKVSRSDLGITVQGPGGLRIEGLSVNDLATLIKQVR